MLTLIRFNIALLLSLVSLSVVGFLGLIAWVYLSEQLGGAATVRFFKSTTCSHFMADIRSQNSEKIEPYIDHLNSLSSDAVARLDNSLAQSEAGLSTLIRGCYKQPNHTLRQIMVEGEGPSLAAQVTDMYNIIDGELKTPNPMAPQLYINLTQPTETTSPTAPTSADLSPTPQSQH